MQAFGPPDEGPLHGFVDSHVETYGGQHWPSIHSTAGSLYPRGSPMLVSPGCAPKATWVGQEGGRPGLLQVRGLLYSYPSPYPRSWVGRKGKAELGQAPRTPHPPQIDGAHKTESQEKSGPQRRCC